MSQKKQDANASSDKWRNLAEEEMQPESETESDLLSAVDDVETPDFTADKKQIDGLKDQLFRAHAEVDNMRRRMEQEVSKARKFGVERLVSDLIPVVDSLARGMEGATSNDPQIQQMRKGMELTLDVLDKILEKNGITPIYPMPGDMFDPAQHEAMSMRSEPGTKPNIILQVLQKGYALNGRVIRAAMVIVSA